MPPFAAIAASEVENNHHHVMTSEDKEPDNTQNRKIEKQETGNKLRRIGHQKKKC